MNWHHPHSVTLGLIVGLVLSQHLILVAAVCLVLGVVVGRCWAGVAALGVAAVDRLRGHEPRPYDREADRG